MKFTTTQQELNKALAFVSKAVTVRSTMPVLKGILLSADDNGMLNDDSFRHGSEYRKENAGKRI